jgi:hypothetical protein
VSWKDRVFFDVDNQQVVFLSLACANYIAGNSGIDEIG